MCLFPPAHFNKGFILSILPYPSDLFSHMRYNFTED